MQSKFSLYNATNSSTIYCSSTTLKKEAAGSIKTSVTDYQSTQCHPIRQVHDAIVTHCSMDERCKLGESVNMQQA